MRSGLKQRPGGALCAAPGEIPESLVSGKVSCKGPQYRRLGAHPLRARNSWTSLPYLATNLTTTFSGSPIAPVPFGISARNVTHAASSSKDARYRKRVSLLSSAINDVGYGK